MNRSARGVLGLLAGLLLLGSAMDVGAQSTVQPYRSYTVDSTGRPIPIPDPYVVDRVIDGVALGVDDLDGPRDMFLDRASGHLFIGDTGNHRVIEVDERGRVVLEIGPELRLKRPQGVYKDPVDGNLWIADTGRSRILHLSPEGKLLAEYGAPESEVLAGLKTSAPSKVALDRRGYIYFLEGSGAGMIVMDRENRFRGFFGTNRVSFSLRWLWARYAATEEQRRKLFLAKPTAHTDMFLADDGFMYTAVAGQTSEQIQKLSPVGVNVFVEKSLEQKLYKSKTFGEKRRSWEPPARFTSVTVDSFGTVSALDANSGRIYQYGQDRNLLMAFGRPGTGDVEFGVPVELEVDASGRLYVLDSSRGVVYVLRPTRFAQLVHQASALQFEGRYEEAASTWQQVLDVASNYELAHSGKGSSQYHERQWSSAMAEYALGRDQLGYSLAFYEYRQNVLRRNMGWLVGVLFVLVVGAVTLPAVTRRSVSGRSAAEQRGQARRLPPFLGILVRPTETLEAQAAGRSLWPAVIVVLLAGMARVLSLALIAFHMRATPSAGSLVNWVRLYRPVAAILLPELRWEEANLLVEMSRIVFPWLLWTVANYGVSALFEGEGTFRGVARTTAYCLVPYIVFAIPIALVSHLMTAQERGIYEILWSLLYYWVLFLLVLQIRTVHNYSTRRTFGVALVMAFGVSVLSGFIVLIGLLGSEMAGFVGELFYDVIRLL